MTEYALAVFALCLILSTLALLCYKNDGAVKLALGMIALYVILSPIVSMARDFDPDRVFDDVTLPDTDGGEGYSSVAKEAFERGICAAVGEKFSLKSENISVKTEGFDFDLMRAEKIKITLSGVAALADRRAIEDYINDMDIGVCSVEIHIG